MPAVKRAVSIGDRAGPASGLASDRAQSETYQPGGLTLLLFARSSGLPDGVLAAPPLAQKRQRSDRPYRAVGPPEQVLLIDPIDRRGRTC